MTNADDILIAMQEAVRKSLAEAHRWSGLSESFELAIAALREQPQWVSVKEKLPEKITNKVLVCCKNGYIGFGHYEKFNGVEDWYNLESGKPFREWNLEDCETYEVTHWMQLPSPPKEETNHAKT